MIFFKAVRSCSTDNQVLDFVHLLHVLHHVQPKEQAVLAMTA
jgi:hypothetical protein